ncbi:hypothetical protein [Nocardia wallacei]|uniref:hypothetical protein n=1 Tax=Nocardia wallacei TaxID=480035 RepID=UPI002456ABF4|nr:hypothetical protein [Nocardia wallacei]
MILFMYFLFSGVKPRSLDYAALKFNGNDYRFPYRATVSCATAAPGRPHRADPDKFPAVLRRISVQPAPNPVMLIDILIGEDGLTLVGRSDERGEP